MKVGFKVWIVKVKRLILVLGLVLAYGVSADVAAKNIVWLDAGGVEFDMVTRDAHSAFQKSIGYWIDLSFFRKCVVRDMMVERYTVDQLISSKDLWGFLESKTSNIMFLYGNKYMSCRDFAKAAHKSELEHYRYKGVLNSWMDAKSFKAFTNRYSFPFSIAFSTYQMQEDLNIETDLLFSGDFKKNLSSYVYHCVFSDIKDGSYTAEELKNSGDVWEFLRTRTSDSEHFTYYKTFGFFKKIIKGRGEKISLTCKQGIDSLEKDWRSQSSKSQRDKYKARVGLDDALGRVEAIDSSKVKDFISSHNIYFVYSRACPDSHAMVHAVRNVIDRFKMDLTSVLFGGKDINHYDIRNRFPNPIKDNGHVKRFGVKKYPVLVATRKNTGEVLSIIYGRKSEGQIIDWFASVVERYRNKNIKLK